MNAPGNNPSPPEAKPARFTGPAPALRGPHECDAGEIAAAIVRMMILTNKIARARLSTGGKRKEAK